eukprot:TRINITY_DN2964_c0_g1_i8.p1 TRINITY_DN2964_c0_g1~~TRINITY_DN2964_c0_g1_i8.p1  ORF type:complete len:131 (-),score=18.58 TRINITY_DN2964_c0_g1_i8:272-664(-)
MQKNCLPSNLTATYFLNSFAKRSSPKQYFFDFLLKLCQNLLELKTALLEQDYLKADQIYFNITLGKTCWQFQKRILVASTDHDPSLSSEDDISIFSVGLRRLLTFWKESILPLEETLEQRQLKTAVGTTT